MLYITGIHALNLECNLDTCGDWHQSALKWKDILADRFLAAWQILGLR